MHWLDTVILTVLGCGAVWGLFTGLLWQVSRVVTLLLGVWASIAFNDQAAQLLRQHVLPEASDTVLRLAAYGVVFLLVSLTLFTATALLNRALKQVQLQWLNRLLGAALGLAKAAFLLGLTFLGLESVPATRPVLEKSALAPHLVEGLRTAYAAIPEEYRDPFRKGVENAADPTTLPAVPSLPPVRLEVRSAPPRPEPPATIEEEARRIAEYLRSLR